MSPMLATGNPLEELCDAITKARTAALRQEIRKPEKQKTFYLSGIHSCARNLFYQLEEGDKREPVDEYVQALFESGKDDETKVVRILLGLGFEFIKAQETIEIKYSGKLKKHHGETMGRGKIDGKIRFKGVEIPTELKSMGEMKWRSIETVDDLLETEYTERYVRQLLLYMYGSNIEFGLFVLSDCRGHLKLIPVYLGNHLDIAETALRTMEKGWEGKQNGEAPERLPNSIQWKICPQCAFYSLCAPRVEVPEGGRIDEPEIESLLDANQKLAPQAHEYEKTKKALNAFFKDLGPTTVSGHYHVTPNRRQRVSYDSKLLTEEQRQEIKKETTYVVLDIREIKP